MIDDMFKASPELLETTRTTKLNIHDPHVRPMAELLGNNPSKLNMIPQILTSKDDQGIDLKELSDHKIKIFVQSIQQNI